MRVNTALKIFASKGTGIMIIGFLLFFSSACQFKNENKAGSLLDINDKPSASADTSVIAVESQKAPIEKQTYYGIDISHYQGDVVKTLNSSDHLHFVICKATQGMTYIDPDFKSNWNMIKEQGLIRGTYHFYVSQDDPTKQAAHFVSTLSDLSASDIAPVLDIEQGSMSSSVSSERMEKDILIFLKAVEDKTGRKPILYTDYSFAQENFKNSELAEYDLWLAEYSSAEQPKIPDLWKEKGYKIWQKSESYNLDSEKTDYDEHNGSLEDLTK